MTPRSMEIDGTAVSDDTPCYVVAEIGNNHQGSVELCAEMLAVAKRCGADAAKLQRRDNQAIFTSAMRAKPYENDNSFGATYGEHREALELPLGAVAELLGVARGLDITLFATAFDERSADELAEVGIPAFKLASGDLVNTPLVEHVARLGLPVILSTGGATLDDVRRAHDAARSHNDQVALLQCTAGYPAAWDELDLRVITTYRQEFAETVIGFSSHDNGIAMAVAAHVLGGRIVEKHFTLDRSMRGTDHSFSLEPVGLTKMVRDLRRLHVALGDGEKRVYESERAPITKMSKALVAAGPLAAGHLIGPEDIAIKSPGDGMPPSDFERLVGARLVHALKEDQAFSLEAIADALSNGAVTSNGSASSLSAAQRAE
jgi:N-acetylneuraminate synthase/sialic acid synthase